MGAAALCEGALAQATRMAWHEPPTAVAHWARDDAHVRANVAVSHWRRAWMSGRPEPLTIDALIEVVGREAFDAACRETSSSAGGPTAPDAPHELSDRLWYAGSESLADRLPVAIELYRRMPSYANLMYWRHRHREFDHETQARMWAAYREFLGDPDVAVAQPVAYSLWVDYFEDESTVERAWSEVSGPEEPRRPRLERVIAASGPVPWVRKALLYESLAAEGGWEDALVAGIYGSCIDLYGSIERKAALRIIRRLPPATESKEYSILLQALADPDLPDTGAERRTYVAQLTQSA